MAHGNSSLDQFPRITSLATMPGTPPSTLRSTVMPHTNHRDDHVRDVGPGQPLCKLEEETLAPSAFKQHNHATGTPKKKSGLGLQHTTGQTQTSPETGVRNWKTNGTASRDATRLAPRSGRVEVGRLSNMSQLGRETGMLTPATHRDNPMNCGVTSRAPRGL